MLSENTWQFKLIIIAIRKRRGTEEEEEKKEDRGSQSDVCIIDTTLRI